MCAHRGDGNANKISEGRTNLNSLQHQFVTELSINQCIKNVGLIIQLEHLENELPYMPLNQPGMLNIICQIGIAKWKVHDGALSSLSHGGSYQC